GKTEGAVAEYLPADQAGDRADRRQRQDIALEDVSLASGFGGDLRPFFFRRQDDRLRPFDDRLMIDPRQVHHLQFLLRPSCAIGTISEGDCKRSPKLSPSSLA